MRKYEKEFLRLVKNELTPLFKIQKSLNISEYDAKLLADYLESNNLIRILKFEFNGINEYVVCKPLIKDTFWRNFWANLISGVIGTCSGVLLTVLIQYMNQQPQQNTQAHKDCNSIQSSIKNDIVVHK